METPPRPLLYFGGELRGDYNADGAVNAADYSIWRDNLGSVSKLVADGDHNGVVDDDDRLVWQANYGAVAAPPAMAVAAAAIVSEVETMSEESTPSSFAFVIANDLDVSPETSRSYRPFTRVATLAPNGQRDLLLVRQSRDADGVDHMAPHDVERSESPESNDATPHEWADFDGAFERLGKSLR
jgi:hypothetical protein